MPISFADELAELLADTERLLQCPEPDLADWEAYRRRRGKLFQRLHETLSAFPGRCLDSDALAHLYEAVLEKDRLLVLKVRQHLSEISRELGILTDRRRLAHTYDTAKNSLQTLHRHTV